MNGSLLSRDLPVLDLTVLDRMLVEAQSLALLLGCPLSEVERFTAARGVIPAVRARRSASEVG